MRFKKYLIESVQSDPEDFLKWISQFPKSGKAPKGKKKEFSYFQQLHRIADVLKKYKSNPDFANSTMQQVQAIFSYITKDELEQLFLKDKTEKIKIGNVTIHNESSMSEKMFKQKAKAIGDFLKSLKGFHKKVLAKPLDVYFKPSRSMKARAVYKNDLDQIWLKSSAKINELYGHLLYQILHELGHRYDRMYGLPKGWTTDIFTTRYSIQKGNTEEAFAELFALSHWPKQYKEYEDKINLFKEMMK